MKKLLGRTKGIRNAFLQNPVVSNFDRMTYTVRAARRMCKAPKDNTLTKRSRNAHQMHLQVSALQHNGIRMCVHYKVAQRHVIRT